MLSVALRIGGWIDSKIERPSMSGATSGLGVKKVKDKGGKKSTRQGAVVVVQGSGDQGV